MTRGGGWNWLRGEVLEDDREGRARRWLRVCRGRMGALEALDVDRTELNVLHLGGDCK